MSPFGEVPDDGRERYVGEFLGRFKKLNGTVALTATRAAGQSRHCPQCRFRRAVLRASVAIFIPKTVGLLGDGNPLGGSRL